MAETYRGLTIKIGGDTTALSKALKYSNSAISQTQVELNKLAQALKLDPSNVQVYNTHLNYMGQQASNTAAKLATLRDAQEAVGKEKISIVDEGKITQSAETFNEFVQKYRDGTANIAADTQSAKRVLDTYTEQLAEMYTNLTSYVSNASSVESTELAAAFELAMTPASKLEETIDEIWERFYTLPDGIERSDESINALVGKAQELSESFEGILDPTTMTFNVDEFVAAFEKFAESTGNTFKVTDDDIAEMATNISAYVAKISQSLKSMGDSADASAIEKASENISNYILEVVGSTDLMATKFSNANKNVSLDNIESALEGLRKEMGMSDEQIEILLDQFRDLQDGFKEADTEYKNFLKAEKIIDLEVEIQKVEAQINSMARAMADISVPDGISRSLMYIQENVNALTTSFKQLIETASDMASIISESGQTSVNVDFGDPTSNVEAFEVSMRSLVEAEQTVEEGLAAIRREMDEFTGNNVFLEDVTDNTKSATQQLYDARDAMVDAETHLAELNGSLDHYKSLLEALESIGDVGLQTFVVSHEGEELDEAVAAVVRYINAIEDLDEREEARLQLIDDVRQKLSDLGGTVDGTTGKYRNLAAAEGAVNEAQEAFEDAKMRIALEKLQADLIKTQNQTQKVDQAIRELAQSMTEQSTTGFAENLFGDAEQKLDSMKSSFDSAIGRAKLLTEASKQMPANIDLAERKTQALSQAVEVGKQYAQELRNQMANIMPDGETEEVKALVEDFGSAKNAVIVLSEQVSDLNTKIAQLRHQRDLSPEGSERWEELNSEVKTLEGNLGYVESRLHGIEGATVGAISIERYEELEDKLTEISAKMEQLSKGSIPGGGSDGVDSAAVEQVFSRMLQYAERVGSAVVESANTIDTAYRDMRKTVQGTEEQFKALKDAAIDFSQTHAVSSDTLLEMEALGGQLGVTIDALQEFGQVAANLDIATDIDAETVALQLGQISNVMDDLDEGTFDQFSDALVRLGNNMAAQESSIMNVAQRMSSVANVANMSTPDLLAWSAAIASTGQRSESAATAVSNTITGISAAVASGGKSLQSFAGIAGMSAEQFATAWMTDPSDALKAFINGLESLTDTNTGAIAALEEMGISSVRQETALLGLASTVDVLDDALTMSNDAFNGVSDQWGQAGDAAIEAQKKSEGFSGTMQILKNNAADLSESLGDSLVLPMQIAAQAISGLTDLLNAIPDPIKGVAIAIAGFTSVGGVAIDAIDKLKKNFGELDMNNMPTGTFIETITLKLMDLAPALENNAALAASLGTGLALGGVVLATAAISGLISALADAAAEAEAAEEANDSLSDAHEHLADAIDGVVEKSSDYEDSMRAIKVTSEDATQVVNGVADSIEALAKKIEERQLKLNIDFSQLDEAVGVVTEYTNSTSLTLDQQADLVDAIDTLNDKMGTSFEVIDLTKGIIKDLGDDSIVTAGQIEEWAGKYKKLEEGDKIVQDMDDTYEELARKQKLLVDAEAKLAEMEEQAQQPLANVVSSRREDADAMVGQTKAQSDLMQTYALTTEGISDQKRIVETYRDTVEKLTEQLDEQKQTAHDLSVEELEAAGRAEEAIEKILQVELGARKALKGIDTESMAEQFVHLGATVSDMAELTDYQFTKLIRSYDGTIDSLAEGLRSLEIDFSGTMDEVGKKAEEAAEKVGKATQAEIAAQTAKNTEEYNALKHHLDEIYNNEKVSLDNKYDLKKTEYDKEYDLLVRENSREYDDRKRHLDKIYEDEKNAGDKRYDEKKREYDHEYNALKDSLDRQYDELKRSLDRQYDAIKKSLDRQYDATKKSLDRQYDEVKKSLDRQYDAYKDTLDKEYDAYKDTLDKEYDARKKALDAEQSAQKKAYDSAYNVRKSALDKEYKAAQKASQKYLKDFKNAQQTQVSAFKKATDARVAEINRELAAKKKLLDVDEKKKTDDIDARIAALKGENDALEKAQKEREQQEKISELRKNIEKAKSRKTEAEAQKAYDDYMTELAEEAAKEQTEALIDKLEAEKSMTEANFDERRDALDEQYSAEVDAYKESRAAELEALQEHLDAVYEKEQEAEAAKLEGIKARNDAELEGIKEQNAVKLEALKESHANELAAIKEQNEILLQDRKDQNEIELQAIKDQNEAELLARKDQNEAELLAIKDQNEAELLAIKDANTAILDEQKAANEAELLAKKEANDDALQDIKDANNLALEEMKTNHGIELEELKYEHDDKQTERKRENSEALDTLKEGYDAQLLELKNAHALQLEQMKADHTAQISQMRTGQAETDGVLDETVTSFQKHGESARQKFGESLAPTADDSKETAKNIMAKTAEGVSEGKNLLEAIVGAAYSTFYTGVKDVAPQTVGNTNDLMDGIQARVKAGQNPIEAAFKTGVSMWMKQLGTMPGTSKKHSDNAVGEVEKSFKKAKGTKKASEHLTGEVEDGVKPMPKKVKTQTDSAVGEAEKSLKNAKGIKAAAEKLPSEAESGAKSTGQKLRAVADDGVGQYASAIQSAKGVRSAGVSAANEAVNGAKSRTDDMDTIGHNYIVGMINGMNGVSLWDAAYNIGMDALDAIKSALGIASPSKEMIKVGRYFVQGAEIGIRQEGENLERQIRLTSQSMSEAIKPQLDVDDMKRKSEVLLNNYSKMLDEMSRMSRDSASGIGSVGDSLDVDSLREISRKYLSMCRNSVNEVLKAAETYADSAEDFDASFDVDSFRQSSYDYIDVYKSTMYHIERMMRNANDSALARGSSPLLSEFDIHSLISESDKFEKEYLSAIDKVEALAKQHRARAEYEGTFGEEFDADTLGSESRRFASEYQRSVDEVEGISNRYLSNVEPLDGGIDANQLKERSQKYLAEYKELLDAMRNYAYGYSSEIERFDIGGLGDGVDIGDELMASIIDGMARMEGELEHQIDRLVKAIEDGFNPTFDLGAMQNASDRMLADMTVTMDKAVQEWKFGAERMRAEQDALMADMSARQEDLARRLTSVVSGGFGDDRLTEQVTAFLDRTVVAAYEAIDKIDARMRNSAIEIAAMQAEAFGKAQYVGMIQSQQPATVNINVTLTDVTIRETADIDKLAQALAQRTNQIMRSRIG